ncbi:MAG TPA: hypothetical protein VFH74_15420 [Gaiellales bacterium]|nr:hypothetical protein [Gaiellales bacterium]
MINRLLAATVLAAGFLAASAAGAAAAAPSIDRSAVSVSHVIAAGPDTCAFDIVSSYSGTVRTVTFSDGTQQTTLSDFHLTYTNPITGRSLTTPLAGPFFVTPKGDGTVTSTIDGNDGRFVIPGQGRVFADVGRFVYIAPADNPNIPLDIIQVTGEQDPSPFPAVCAYLGGA